MTISEIIISKLILITNICDIYKIQALIYARNMHVIMKSMLPRVYIQAYLEHTYPTVIGINQLTIDNACVYERILYMCVHARWGDLHWSSQV